MSRVIRLAAAWTDPPFDLGNEALSTSEVELAFDETCWSQEHAVRVKNVVEREFILKFNFKDNEGWRKNVNPSSESSYTHLADKTSFSWTSVQFRRLKIDNWQHENAQHVERDGGC